MEYVTSSVTSRARRQLLSVVQHAFHDQTLHFVHWVGDDHTQIKITDIAATGSHWDTGRAFAQGEHDCQAAVLLLEQHSSLRAQLQQNVPSVHARQGPRPSAPCSLSPTHKSARSGRSVFVVYCFQTLVTYLQFVLARGVTSARSRFNSGRRMRRRGLRPRTRGIGW